MSGLGRAFPRLSGLPGGTDRPKAFKFKDIEDEDYELEIKEPHITEILSRLRVINPADYAMARRVAGLMNRYPDGTIPELMTYDWLKNRDIEFTYRGWISGSRGRSGAIEGDFILAPGGIGMAWMVDGVYWHGRPDRAALDQVGRMLLIGSVAFGVRIEVVVALQEPHIYDRRPEVFELALAGIEMPL